MIRSGGATGNGCTAGFQVWLEMKLKQQPICYITVESVSAVVKELL